ncbi:MAG: hypothetical protein Q4B90_04985 [Eubacteriales bacterium]|nr:hypothetical protein [Eubacteriales bacterium]
MKKEKIIFADPDQEYLNFLEGMVVPYLESDTEIVMISEFSYFQKYTNILEKEDLLFVWKEWAQEVGEIKNDHVILIGDTEESEKNLFTMPHSWDERAIKEQIHVLRTKIQKQEKEAKETKTLLIYSPIGGSGVSAAARESAEYLAERGEKVFFIGADTWQDCRKMVEKRLDETAEVFFAAGQKGGFSAWKQWICHKNFDLLPPFQQSYVCLGLNLDFFRKIEKEVQMSGRYDWIVVEMDHAYDERLAQWMADADKILLIIRPGEKWEALIPVMKKSMALIPREKFCFVYNFFESSDMEEDKARQFGWDGEIFLGAHGQTKKEWEVWRKRLGEVLCE